MWQGDRLHEISPSMNGFLFTSQTATQRAQGTSPGSVALHPSVLQHGENAFSGLLSLEKALSGGAAFSWYHNGPGTGQHWLEN